MKVARHKYKAVRTDVNGRKYASKAEASYAKGLACQRDAGIVLGWFEQVPLHLACGARYVLDFLVFYTDGTCRAVEVKGYETAAYKLKAKMVANEYPWLPVEVIAARTAGKRRKV